MAKRIWIWMGLLLWVAPLWAGGGHGGPALKPAQTDLFDTASLQRGAVAFAQYCQACHSIKYMRYNRIARDLGWTDEQVISRMAYGLRKPTDHVLAWGDQAAIARVLGTTPPDLSLMARRKGTDYIYSFLLGYFEKDPKKGVWDNHYLPGTAMPNVLEAHYRFSAPEKRIQLARDITNFLDYVGEPAKLTRLTLGWKVLLFLLLLFIVTYLLKREFWRDVK